MGWADQAACRGVNINVFFPHVEPGDHSIGPYRAALRFCTDCPVKAECLAFVMPFEAVSGRRDGMYGGLTPAQRAERGRPLRRIPIR